MIVEHVEAQVNLFNNGKSAANSQLLQANVAVTEFTVRIGLNVMSARAV